MRITCGITTYQGSNKPCQSTLRTLRAGGRAGGLPIAICCQSKNERGATDGLVGGSNVAGDDLLGLVAQRVVARAQLQQRDRDVQPHFSWSCSLSTTLSASPTSSNGKHLRARATTILSKSIATAHLSAQSSNGRLRRVLS